MNQKHRPGIPGFILGFPALVAVILLGFGVPMLLQAVSFMRASVSVPGTITAMREETNCTQTRTGRDGRSLTTSRTECSRIWYPTLRFRDADGVVREVEAMRFLPRPLVETGDEVAIRHLRSDPLLAQIDDWRAIWAIPGGVVTAGLLALGAFIWLRRVSQRNALAAPPLPRGEPVPLWVSAVSLAVPGLMALLAGFMARDVIEFRMASRLTQGIVMEGDTGPDARPVFRYHDQFGQLREGKPETSPFETFNVPGREVPLFHRMDDTTVFRAAPETLSIWKGTLVVSFWAALFGTVIVGALRFMASE